MTKKLFEIPIYAFRPEVLDRKATKAKQLMVGESYERSADPNAELTDKVIEVTTHPFRLFNYNHIVGYIVISTDHNDVFFELYKQAHGARNKSHYYWNTQQKWFLENQRLNGYHFRLNEKFSSDDIRREIHRLLDGIIREQIPKRFFVDREAFDNVDRMIDYSLLARKEENDGQTQDAHA